jgi:hypothetical protein
MKYVLGVFGIIILAIVAVVLISTTTSNRSNSVQEGEPRVNVEEFANKTATFSQTSQGKIVGLDDFRAIRVTVSPSERRVQILKGYDNAVEKEQIFTNTQAAYDVFVRALDNAGYSLERNSANEELRGSCPLGRRYLYELQENNNQVLSLWSSSCGRSEGNFGGNSQLVQQIFKNQIPLYSTFVRGVRL